MSEAVKSGEIFGRGQEGIMEENTLTIAEINFFKQLQFEKKNQEDRVSYLLNYLESRLSSIEENHELILSNLRQSQSSIKSLENKLSLVRHDLKEKESIIDTSESYKEKISETVQNLSLELKSLKKMLKQQNYTEDVELLKAKLCDLEKTFSQHAKEKSKLKHELISMSEELLLHISNEGNLAKQVKKLENEKLELKADHKTLMLGILEDKNKPTDICQLFLTTTPNWESSIHELNLFKKAIKTNNEVLSFSPFDQEYKNESLWKEILEVEQNCRKEILKEEKQAKKKEKCIFGRTINRFGNSERNYQDFQLLTFYFPDNLSILQESCNSRESHSKQSDTLLEGAYVSVSCKDVIQLNQPESLRIVNTVSTASQTEFFENASHVFFSGLAQKNQLTEYVSEEAEYFFQNEEEIKNKKNHQIFWNHKNCDLDMDLYRSCRKLSVLPEEEIDDILTKKNSLESSYSFKQECLKSQDFFLEDIKKAKCFKPNFNEMSASNLLIKPKLSQKDLPNSDNNPSASYFEETKLKLLNNELLLSVMSPRDAFKQPLSFDSYLEPPCHNNSFLIRQISDPSQNTICASSLIGRRTIKGERASLIKRPGSTCRPLRLPCDKNGETKDRKLYSVRVNVPEQIRSTEINFKDMNFNSLAAMKSNNNFRMISTFKIEIEDKINFNKFLEKKNLPNDENKNLIYFKEIKKTKSVLGINSTAFNKSFCDAVEGLYTLKLDVGFSCGNDDVNHFCQVKKRQKSDSSHFFGEDCREKCSLETNRPCSDSDIPCIGPIIKNVFDTSIDSINMPKDNLFILQSYIPDLTAGLNLNKCLPAYISKCEKLFEELSSNFSISKSEAILKNIASFDIVNFPYSDTNLFNEIVQKESPNFQNLQSKEEQLDVEKEINQHSSDNEDHESINRDSFDISEGSESDTLTYKTVNTHLFPSLSDCDSDVYVTIRSEGSSLLERKSSDFSEDSSSPYTTPPDTSSASFCTPPDNYSPILSSLKHYPN